MAKTTVIKIVLIVAAVAAFLAFFYFDFGHAITLAYVKAQQLRLAGLYHEHPVAFISGYVLAYIIITSLSLPVALLLTLAGGALFGLIIGIIVVLIASTIGATLAFLISRFLFRDLVAEWLKDKLPAVYRGMEKEGGFFLFALRLVPLFPFWVVNLAMGLTPLKTRTFFWVSLVGMLPAVVAHVNAGTQLAQINTLSDIFSLKVIISFAIIGLIPLVSHSFLRWHRTLRLYRPFRRPTSFDYNLMVIGGGSGGLVAANIAATLKAKVALIEKNLMGGDCLNTGCVPSKTLIKTAKLVSYGNRAREFGLNVLAFELNFSEVMRRIARVIGKISPKDSVERYTSLGVDCLQGSAKILSPYSVQVNSQIYTTKNIVIASGASPLVPPIAGLAQTPYLTTDTLWRLQEQPRRLLVLGGGPIGCELAQAFARLGSEVTIVETQKKILLREDNDASDLIAAALQKDGIRILTAHEAKLFTQGQVLCEAQGQEVIVQFDHVLLALGRRATTSGLGLEALNLELGPNGMIPTDSSMQTRYPNIFACGDVTGPYQFTHMAAEQGFVAAANALFRPFKKWRCNYRAVAWATFTDPEVARVGLNESEAQAKRIPYELARFDLADLDRAITEEEDRGFVKILLKPKSDTILGACIVGAQAGEIIAPLVLAMNNNLGLNAVLRTTHIYPTLAEANRLAAGQWKRDKAPQGGLALLSTFHTWRRKGRNL